MTEVRDGPVAIGGVGGSGTRLAARILLELGFYLGSELNESLDNLCFTRLFKRVEAVDCPDAEFEALFAKFRKAMSAASADAPWAWKEPNTHVVLPRLNALLPNLRYIHVARNGLDMAYSQNQNQLRMWGARFLGTDEIRVTPRMALKYWVAVHRRILKTGSEMGNRFLLLNYDQLCTNGLGELSKLLMFLDLEPSAIRLVDTMRWIAPSPGIGRFKAHLQHQCQPADQLDPADVEYVKGMGFDTTWAPGKL